MERAQAHEIGAAFFELHIAPDDVHNVGPSQQFLDKSLGDRHLKIVGVGSGSVAQHQAFATAVRATSPAAGLARYHLQAAGQRNF